MICGYDQINDLFCIEKREIALSGSRSKVPVLYKKILSEIKSNLGKCLCQKTDFYDLAHIKLFHVLKIWKLYTHVEELTFISKSSAGFSLSLKKYRARGETN